MAPPSTPPIPAPKPSSAVMEEVSKLMREIKEPNPQGIDVKSAGGATNEKTIYRELMKRGALKKGRKWVLPVAVGLSVLAAIIAGLIINPAITIVIIAIAVFILIRRSAY
jgi:Flp pilus assembly protein TadB